MTEKKPYSLTATYTNYDIQSDINHILKYKRIKKNELIKMLVKNELYKVNQKIKQKGF